MTEAERLINDLRVSYDVIVHTDLDKVLDAMKVAYRAWSEFWKLRSIVLSWTIFPASSRHLFMLAC